jgi:hypothetical protein
MAGSASPDPASPNLQTAEGLPDLIVDLADLRQNWVVRVENLPATFCSVIEGGVTPGERHLLRFTVSTANIGDADLVIGDPNVHFEANDGLFEFATCHNHFHFRNYTLYQLIDPVTGQTWHSAKTGFCMEDTKKFQDYTGEADNKPKFRNCGEIGIPGNQGISKGWKDTYLWTFGGQYFVLDGGDGQPPVPPGQYIIRITVNPAYTPGPDNPCRFPDPLRPGLCHSLPESDFENNIGQVTITVQERGRHAVGPLKNEPVPTSEPID